MHEFSICRGLIGQVETIARQHSARRIYSISLRIGPLAGVDVALLQHAFPVASAASIVDGAKLEIECSEIRIRCHNCGMECAAACNDLHCTHCGDWRTELIQGNELLLVDVELELEESYV